MKWAELVIGSMLLLIPCDVYVLHLVAFTSLFALTMEVRKQCDNKVAFCFTHVAKMPT